MKKAIIILFCFCEVLVSCGRKQTLLEANPKSQTGKNLQSNQSAVEISADRLKVLEEQALRKEKDATEKKNQVLLQAVGKNSETTKGVGSGADLAKREAAVAGHEAKLKGEKMAAAYGGIATGIVAGMFIGAAAIDGLQQQNVGLEVQNLQLNNNLGDAINIAIKEHDKGVAAIKRANDAAREKVAADQIGNELARKKTDIIIKDMQISNLNKELKEKNARYKELSEKYESAKDMLRRGASVILNHGDSKLKQALFAPQYPITVEAGFFRDMIADTQTLSDNRIVPFNPFQEGDTTNFFDVD